MVTAADDRSRASVVPPGTRLGRYEVITQIASGGMATVYLGRVLGAAGFQRLVAIKTMHPHYATDEEFVAMFMDEARLAARIRHPNVVSTLDLENGDEGFFLVMEWIEGDGLLGLLRAAGRLQKRMPAPVAIRIVLDVLAGLHAAHELVGDTGEPLRLVHRDVSPHNILVGSDGVGRITDFGIAHADARASHTREGQLKGKLSYMAPEQTTSAPLDRRVDVFATGVVLWEALAGKRLFQGQSDGEVLRKLTVEPIPTLRDVFAEVSDELSAVCARALARDPDERFATAAHFAEALESVAGAGGVANARTVAAFVREVAGEKIDTLARQVRAYATENAISAVRPVTFRTSSTDLGVAPATVGSVPPPLPEGRTSSSPAPALSRADVSYLPADAVMEADEATTLGRTRSAAPPARSAGRRTPVLLAVVLLAAGVGLGATWWLLRSHEDAMRAANASAPRPPLARTAPRPPTAFVPPPTPVNAPSLGPSQGAAVIPSSGPPARPEANTAIAAPVEEPLALDRGEARGSAGGRRPVGHVGRERPAGGAPTSAVTPASGTSVTAPSPTPPAPAPAPEAFNPEAM